MAQDQELPMRSPVPAVLLAILFATSGFAGQGMRGDPQALADAVAMVEAMGGVAIWSQMNSIHFVHEWYPWNRMDSYVENEYLDLTGPRSLADRKSEISHSIRAYSPEGGRWNSVNGRVTYEDKAVLAQDLERAAYNFYQLVKAVAIDDPHYEVRYGEGDIPTSRRLEFYGPDGKLGGWVILNARKEPIVKATPAYRYTLGPLKRFGNLRIPAWGVYDNGWTRYEVIDVTGDRDPPDISLFMPPAKTGGKAPN
jgi:lipocalin